EERRPEPSAPRKRREPERSRFRGDKAGGESNRASTEKPRKRRSSPHHVWRDEGKPVRAKFRGARAERRNARTSEDRGEASEFSDRKGRKVRLVRVGSKPKDDERAHKRSRTETKNPRSDARKRRGFDRRSGPRPSRPRER